MTYSYNNSILGDYLTPSGNQLIVENPIVINSGSINNTVIGNNIPSSGYFTNLRASGITNIIGTLQIDGSTVNTSASELNVLDGVTPGTASSGKAIVLDNFKTIGGLQAIVTEGSNYAGYYIRDTETQNYSTEIYENIIAMYNPATNYLGAAIFSVYNGTVACSGNSTVGGNLIVLGTGLFNNLSVNNIPVSVSGHSHVSTDISDFNIAVSGASPVKDIVAGTGTSISSSSGIYTINSIVTSVDEANKLVTNVFNKTGSPIPKFSVVYINGGQGDQPTIALASASGESTSSKTYGITAENIGNMSAGKVVVNGALTGLNTDQFNPTAPTGDVNGTVLYLSPTTPGGVTTTKPRAPNHMVAVGTIVRTHQNEGVVEVRIQNGFELEELHNVAVSGVTNGQFLQYNSSSGLWVPSNSGQFSYLGATNASIGNLIVGAGGPEGGALNIDISGDVTYGTWSASPIQIQYGGTGSNNVTEARAALGVAPINTAIFSLGTISGSNAINFAVDRMIQTLTLNGTSTTFTKGTGWPTNSTSVDVVLRITVNAATSITWTIVTDWFSQPPTGALATGTYLFLLRAIGSTIIEGHYLGEKTN